MSRLVRTLPEGPLDLIGDIHGEIDALRALLRRLGCDPERATAERPLVFVGDLIDRGPDSPAVVALVRRLVEAGVAYAVAGNHELNLLLQERKEGNGWFWADPTDAWQPPTGGAPLHVPFPSRLASARDRTEILDFLRTLPLALERPDLRVVHAAWHDTSIDALRDADDLVTTSRAFTAHLESEWRRTGLLDAARAERHAFADLRRRDVEPDRPLPHHTALEVASQSEHPVKVVTSGLEHAIHFERRFFVGGRWRLVERTAWWATYDAEPAVVMGHYWRLRGAHRPGKPDFFGSPPFAWLGPTGRVFCVDFSVGRRYAERWEGRHAAFHHGLAALRWPERTLVFDDRDDVITTTGFGRDAR
jgi:hypothetical protein